MNPETPKDIKVFNTLYFNRIRRLHHHTRRVLGYIEDLEFKEIATSPSPCLGVSLTLQEMGVALNLSTIEVEWALIELRDARLITEFGPNIYSPADARHGIESLVDDLLKVLPSEGKRSKQNVRA